MYRLILERIPVGTCATRHRRVSPVSAPARRRCHTKWDRLLSVLLIFSLGCNYPLPKGYVQAPTPGNAKYRAVSAEGSALMLSTEGNPDNGDLAFWEKAIQTRLTEIGGYKLDNRREIANDHGLKGSEMTFSINQDGIDYVYMVSLFIRGKTIYIFEAAGRKDTFTPDIPEIQKSVAAWPL